MYSMNRSIYLNVVTIILMEKCLTIQIIYRKDTKKYMTTTFHTSLNCFVPELRKWFVSSKKSKSSELKGSTKALSSFGAKLSDV